MTAGLANNEYGILTTYVPDFDQLHLNLNGRFEVRAYIRPYHPSALHCSEPDRPTPFSNQVPQICKTLYTKPDNMVRNEQATNCIWLSRPKLTVSWAAGFSFNKVRDRLILNSYGCASKTLGQPTNQTNTHTTKPNPHAVPRGPQSALRPAPALALRRGGVLQVRPPLDAVCKST